VNSLLRTLVGHKSNDPCFYVFLMEARIMTLVAHFTSGSLKGELSIFERQSLVPVEIFDNFK